MRPGITGSFPGRAFRGIQGAFRASRAPRNAGASGNRAASYRASSITVASSSDRSWRIQRHPVRADRLEALAGSGRGARAHA